MDSMPKGWRSASPCTEAHTQARPGISDREGRDSASDTPRSRVLTGDAPGDWLESLHSRACDRIDWALGRWWLQRHSRLEPATAAGWPVLRLVLTAAAPPGTSGLLLMRHFRDALGQGCKGCGPLADLAASLELQEVGK